MNILTLSKMYPSNIHQANRFLSGTFIHEITRAINDTSDDITNVAIAPVPYVPSFLKMHNKYHYYSIIPEKEIIDSVSIFRPRRIGTPGGKPQVLVGDMLFYCIKTYIKHLHSIYKFDIIHGHTLGMIGHTTVKIARMLNIPAVCTLHGGDINFAHQKNPIVQHKSRRVLDELDHIITVSEALKNNTIKFHNKIQTPISIVSNGVDLEKFPLISKAEIQQELGINNQKRNILFVGNLIEVKGLERLIMNLYKIKYNYHLYLIGEGDLKEKLKNLAKESGLQSNISFLGYKKHNEIFKWMNGCDLLVLPSFSEGWPTVIFEAFACGLPVVASAVGGIPEIITPDANGYIFSPDDNQGMIDLLNRGLTKKWDRNEIHNYAATNTWKSKAQEVINIYSKYSS